MIINNELLDKLAYLCRLSISPTEQDAMLHDLNELVAWVEHLDEIDNELDNDMDADPFFLLGTATQFRADIVLDELSKEEALRLAPSSDSSYFRVPAVKI